MSHALSGSLGGSAACPVATRRGPAASVTPFVTVGLLAVMAALAKAQIPDIDLSNVANGTGGFVINGQEAPDSSGFSVSSAGDVNGDGLADLIVGAPGSSPASGYSAGRSYVVFGKTGGSAVDLSAVDNGTGGFVINGQGVTDQSGVSVSSAGDVNGDGLADVVVGALNSDPATGTDAGRSYVVFGKTDGADADLSAIDGGVGGFVINGQTTGEQSGNSVSSAGDVNGDGLADLIVGALNSRPVAGMRAGRSYVVFGKTGGASVELSAIDNGFGGFVINGHVAYDYSGVAVASAGDVNGDGLADVIVGASGGDPLAGSRAGRSYIVFGKSTTNDVDLSAIDGTGPSGGTGGFVINGQVSQEGSGGSVSSAGDVNGDGLADVIVGASGSDPVAGSNAGRSYVVFGKTGTSDVELSAIDAGVGGFVINGQAVDDFSGSSASSAGDMNGDGLADVVVGAPFSDPGSGSSTGRSYVVLGRVGGADVDLSAVDNGIDGFVIDGEMAGDYSGHSVSSAGDVNGDGMADVIVGAPGSDPGAGAWAGRSYVVFSPLPPETSGIYRGVVAAGDSDRNGIGIHRFGDDETIFPDSRAWVDFDGGTGPGPGMSSSVEVALTRNDSGIGGGFVASNLADLQWQVSTDRTGWSNCRVTVRYTDAEIVSLTEGSLVLYTAPTAAGPWRLVGGYALDTARNEASGTLSSLPAVLVAATEPPELTPPTAMITRLDQTPTRNQVVRWQVWFSEPVLGTVELDEITPTGTLAGGTFLTTISGVPPPLTISVVVAPEDAAGTIGFDILAGAVTDLVGNPLAATSAPAYTLTEEPPGLAGDVDENGTVNVADVTLLSNFIVNGAPPLP